jgi:polysaccharide biosynthesis transport protein
MAFSDVFGNPHGSAAMQLGQGQPVPNARSFELGELLRIFAERRRIILGATIAGLLLGVLATVMMTPRYRASATIELNSQGSQVIDANKGGGQGAIRFGSQEILGTQVGLLRSEALARRVAQDLNLASRPSFGGAEGTRQQKLDRAASTILASSSVESIKNSLLIQVSYTDGDPQVAASVANALARGAIAANLDRRYDASSYARQFLSDQLAKTKAAIEESERNLNNYSIESDLFNTPGQIVDGKSTGGSTLAAAELAAMQGALNQATVKRIDAEQAYRNGVAGSSGERTAQVGSLVEQLAVLRADYDEKLKLFKPDYPLMREMSARIERLNRTIAEERGRASGNQHADLQSAFASARDAEVALAQRVNAAKNEVQSERSRMIQYSILQREVDTNRSLYDALLQRYKEIGVAGGIGESNISLVDPADAPNGPYSPRLPVNLALGLLLGFGFGVGLAFAVHMLFDNIADAADVRNKLHLPVLGVVPTEPEGRSLLEALADRKSDVSEAYYSVRTALKFSRPEGAPHTLLVTSTKPSEGKSTSAYAIASSMARLGSKVLLIDADLRKPTFVSNREDGYGLAHLLGVDDRLSNYVEPTQIDNLSLIPVGRFVGSAAELLGSNRLSAIISEAAAEYEMVVIDGPPVMGFADAPLLASATEATAIVVESRGTRTGHVLDMVRRLRESGGNVLGVILTKVPKGGTGYGYEYYSYSYGGEEGGGAVTSNPNRRLDLGTSEA